MNTVLRYLLYIVAVLVYFYVADKCGVDMHNWFMGIPMGASSYALFGWILTGSKSDKGATNIGLASGVYQSVGFSRGEATTRRRKV